ncbi:MAG: hypothetical protein SGI83_09120 [Bacteroidota bacterium]|nr:hypothetical protein [Bacteroidota bacterium]
MGKRIIFSIILFFTIGPLFAQVEKNKWYGILSVGRKIFYYNTNMLQPSLSIGLTEHSELGIFYNYTRFNSSPSALYGGHISSHAVGTSYKRYHYFKKSHKWGWYLDGSLSFNRISIYDNQSGSLKLNNRYSEGELSVAPGLFLMASARIMLFANIGSFSVAHNRYESFDLRSSFVAQLNIGARFSISNPNKKKSQQTE